MRTYEAEDGTVVSEDEIDDLKELWNRYIRENKEMEIRWQMWRELDKETSWKLFTALFFNAGTHLALFHSNCMQLIEDFWNLHDSHAYGAVKIMTKIRNKTE